MPFWFLCFFHIRPARAGAACRNRLECRASDRRIRFVQANQHAADGGVTGRTVSQVGQCQQAIRVRAESRQYDGRLLQRLPRASQHALPRCQQAGLVSWEVFAKAPPARRATTSVRRAGPLHRPGADGILSAARIGGGTPWEVVPGSRRRVRGASALVSHRTTCRNPATQTQSSARLTDRSRSPSDRHGGSRAAQDHLLGWAGRCEGGVGRGIKGVSRIATRPLWSAGHQPATSADRTPTRVGLLYTPEHLADLARRSPKSVSARMAAAIRQQTPIVVLWSIPPNASVGLWPRPVIVENGDAWAAPRIEPLWADQTADDLRQLDPTTPFEDVGVMAAFPRSAFGRFITIYVDLPAEGGHKHRRVQRFGRIEWSGVQALQ